MAKRLLTEDYIKGLQKGDRAVLSKAITLAESELAQDNELIRGILEKLMPATGKSLRIAITGVPGAGKSTFIEALGKNLTKQGKRVAVLAVDPTSTRTKGSIMGDKTRMEDLARDPNAFIRPSPSGKSLGGITRRTRESILLCEAAGFDIILIETVGVGQIETSVHGMVDFFMVLILTGAGDELQVIKKGVIELADMIVINKAEGENKLKAESTKGEIERVMDIFPVPDSGWKTSVLTASSTEQKGITEVWDDVQRYFSFVKSNGYFFENRKQQNVRWMRESVVELLVEDFNNMLKENKQKENIEKEVSLGKIPALNGALRLFDIFRGR
jgi:LAO/AO transport system kinase